jgi:transcriptional regulator with XRE-family HTH domain
MIENEKTSPNVSTLQQLAVALHVPITAFFEVSTIEKEVVYQKLGQRPQANFPQGELEDLGGGIALGEATPLLLTMDPNATAVLMQLFILARNLFIVWRARWCIGLGQMNTSLNQATVLFFKPTFPIVGKTEEKSYSDQF